MAAFLSRTVDGVLKRGSHRAALNHFWTPQNAAILQLTTVGLLPQFVRSDGEDLWVTNFTSNSVSRVRGSDGRLLETWTGATGANNVMAAVGRVFANNLSGLGVGRAGFDRRDRFDVDGQWFERRVRSGFDGERVLVTDNNTGAVSLWKAADLTPLGTFSVGIGSSPFGACSDGTSFWIVLSLANKLARF